MGNRVVFKERRTQIIEAFRVCATEKGLNNTSIRDIAVKAGVRPGVVHYYFKNREEMIEVLVQSAAKARIEHFSEYIGNINPPESRMEKAIDYLFSPNLIKDDTGRIFYDFWALAKRNENVRKSFVNVYVWFRETVVKVICDLSLDYAFTKKDAEDSASMIIALYEGVFLQWDLDREHVNLNRMASLAKLLIEQYVALKTGAATEKKITQNRTRKGT